MVKADDDDEYLQIDDFYTYNAYRYWQLYGFSADTSTSYTNTLNTISQGTATGSFTFSGSFSGSFDANVQLAISGLTSTELDDVDDILTSRTFYYFGEGSEANPLIEMTISSDDEGTEYIPRYACTYNPSATGASATMTCTPNSYDGAFTIPDQDVKVTSIDVAMNSLTDYNLTLTLKNENTVRGTLSGTLGLSGNGQGTLTMTENGSATTTTINTNSLEYTLPIMKASSIDNSYEYNVGNNNINIHTMKSLWNDVNNPMTFIFLTYWDGKLTETNGKTGIKNMINVYGVFNSGDGGVYNKSYNFDVSNINNQYGRFGGLKLYAFSVIPEQDSTHPNFLKWFHIKWNLNSNILNYGMIPLFVGQYNNIPDDLFRFAYGRDRNIEAIEAQTAADQQHHNEMMDTSDSSKIQTDGDALVNDADEKFGDLFFPLNHAIETANDLANVNATGVIRLPAIFSDGDYWYLDLTQIEQNLPEAWTFIRSLCQLAVAIYMIHGLYSLFFGGKEDDS